MSQNNETHEAHEALARLQAVIDRLLDPKDGCAWDQEQYPPSLTEYIVEECFELVDAIRSGNSRHVCEEMGDVFFLLMFVAQRYQQQGAFGLGDVFDGVAQKMVRRHPHVFSNASFANLEEFTKAWDEIKKQEQAEQKEQREGVFSGLSRGLPPLTKAYRLHSKAARVGFTWDEQEEVERQVESEWLELLDACADGNEKSQEHELGDMLFSLVELGRRKGIKAAVALDNANNRFLARFEAMEKIAKEKGLDFAALTLDEKDELWNEVKAQEAAALS